MRSVYILLGFLFLSLDFGLFARMMHVVFLINKIYEILKK